MDLEKYNLTWDERDEIMDAHDEVVNNIVKKAVKLLKAMDESWAELWQPDLETTESCLIPHGIGIRHHENINEDGTPVVTCETKGFEKEWDELEKELKHYK